VDTESLCARGQSLGENMKKLLAPIVAASLAFTTSMAMAGGPVVIQDDVEVVAEKSGSSVGILPVILVAVALCAALCGSDEPDRCTAAVNC
jgi:predicted anti-sigma-YlaC factor YlaD